MKYILQSLLPGILFILAAFWAGSQGNMIFSLLGFLSFFVIGVTLIIEGAKKKKDKKENS